MLVISDEIANTLIQMRHQRTWDSWYIGDTSTLMCMDAQENGKNVTYHEIQSEIGYYAGLSARTVRFYESLARFFLPGTCVRCATLITDDEGKPCVGGTELVPHPHVPNVSYCPVCQDASTDVRSAYEQLAIRHFAIAAKKQYQERWREVLEYCMGEGTPRSVDACEAHFAGNISLEKHTFEIDLQPEKVPAGIASALHNSLVYAERFVSMYPMPASSKSRIMAAIGEIRRIVGEVLTADMTIGYN